MDTNASIITKLHETWSSMHHWLMYVLWIQYFFLAKRFSGNPPAHMIYSLPFFLHRPSHISTLREFQIPVFAHLKTQPTTSICTNYNLIAKQKLVRLESLEELNDMNYVSQLWKTLARAGRNLKRTKSDEFWMEKFCIIVIRFLFQPTSTEVDSLADRSWKRSTKAN